MIPSPKARFAADSEAAKRHADIVTSAAFQTALEAALLSYAAKCAKEPISDAGHFKAQGAFEFAEALCSIQNPRTDSIPKDFDNLR